MTPRARRSESITLPPGNHPGLVRYKDEKDFPTTSEKQRDSDSDDFSESDFPTTSEKQRDSGSDDFSESDLGFNSSHSDDDNDSYDDRTSNSNSVSTKPHGR